MRRTDRSPPAGLTRAAQRVGRFSRTVRDRAASASASLATVRGMDFGLDPDEEHAFAEAWSAGRLDEARAIAERYALGTDSEEGIAGDLQEDVVTSPAAPAAA